MNRRRSELIEYVGGTHGHKTHVQASSGAPKASAIFSCTKIWHIMSSA